MTMFRIEYTLYNGIDNCRFADDSERAYAMAKGLSKLRHISNVRVVDATQEDLFQDRFMYCAQCNFSCRFSQLPEGFTLDTDEPDNPFVWCASFMDRESCTFRKEATPPDGAKGEW